MDTQQAKYQTRDQIQAITSEPVRYLEDVWGQDIRADKKNRDNDTSTDLRFGKRDQRFNASSSLPYQTSPRSFETPDTQIIAENTRVNRVCLNDQYIADGPAYLRSFQIWDNAPIKPSVGDVTKDPRYGMITKSFTSRYTTL